MSLGHVDAVSVEYEAGPRVGRSVRLGPHRVTWKRRYFVSLVLADCMVAAIGGIVAYMVRFSDDLAAIDARGPVPGYFWLSILMPVLWPLALLAAHTYDDRAFGVGYEEFTRTARAAIGLTAAVAFLSYATKAEIARGYVVLAIPLTAGLSLLARYAGRRILSRLRRAGHCVADVVVVGREHTVVDLVSRLRTEPDSALKVVGACLPEGSDPHRLAQMDIPIIGDVDHVGAAVGRAAASAVAVTSDVGPATLRKIGWDLEGAAIDLLVAPGLMEVAGPRLHIRPMTGLPLLHVEEPQFRGVRRMIKGGLDRVGAFALLVVSLPILLAIAVAIRIDNPGPVFFRQVRIGRNGQEFTMLKFRTMVTNAESLLPDLTPSGANVVLFKMVDDPRVTRVGKILRKYSLDELPQLFNVLSGTMSLVGPRPPLAREVALYDSDARRRLMVKPGLTGLWQVSGRADLTWEESVRLDLRYVENWSLLLDIMILWRTLFVVIRGSGAY